MPSLKVPSSLSTLASQNILCCIFQLLTKEELQNQTELEVENDLKTGNYIQYNTYLTFDDQFLLSTIVLF